MVVSYSTCCVAQQQCYECFEYVSEEKDREIIVMMIIIVACCAAVLACHHRDLSVLLPMQSI